MKTDTGILPTWLAITTVLSGVMGLGSLVFVLFVPMLFDSPSSVHNPATVSLAWSIVLFPVFCVLGIVLSWRLSRKNHVGPALAMALLPLLPLLVALLSVTAIEVFYGGSFGS